MVAPLIPLVIHGVRILAPIAARYAAGHLSKRAAVKASQELAKKNKKSLWKKGKEFAEKTGLKGKKGRYKEARGKDGALVGTGKELAKDMGRLYAGEKVIWDPAFKALDKYPEYKKGGVVKKCRMDGIALRGKTRAKQRSK